MGVLIGFPVLVLLEISAYYIVMIACNFSGGKDCLATEVQLIVGVAVALIAVSSAYFLFFFNKPKGSINLCCCVYVVLKLASFSCYF